MIDIGHFALVCAWALALYGVVVGLLGAKRKHRGLISSSENAIYWVFALTALSIVMLGVYFVRHEYQYSYVWRTSNNDMAWPYLISAIWGGMDGSMLLWAFFLTLYSALCVYRSRFVPIRLMSWVTPTLHGSALFFLSVVTFLTNPFRFIPGFTTGAALPTDGNGLNPLLQNPSMLIHPPCLYLGFTGFVVPFAFAIAALCSADTGLQWTQLTRRWTLVAWGFLTCGIILGGNWAYIELGWGGFWAWDPVENASFLPWLTGTAYLHSVMVEERRGMLRVWNAGLSILTYLLTVFGTFLTRSGLVQSVHAFAESDIGHYFLYYISFVVIVSVVLMWKRRADLRSDNQYESFLSREAIFLFNNLLFLAICFATFWGVMLPVFSEAITGKKMVVGAPFFNAINTPLFLLLLFFMSVGPLIAWRKTKFSVLKKIFLKPFLAGSFVAVLFLTLDFDRRWTAIAFGLCTFLLFSIVGEFYRAAKIRREIVGGKATLLGLVRAKPRRYGGLIVHLGVMVMAVAITASMSYKIERDFAIRPGEEFDVGRFTLVLKRLSEANTSNHSSLFADVEVFDRFTRESIAHLRPEKRFYPKSQQSTSEVDIRMTPRDDLYLALAGLEVIEGEPETASSLQQSKAVFKVFVNPLQIWLWFGSFVVLLGTVIVLRPRLSEILLAAPEASIRASLAPNSALGSTKVRS